MFYASDAGSVNYYKKEGDKAGYNDLICSVDKAGNISEEISQAGMDTANLSDEELLNIQNTIRPMCPVIPVHSFIMYIHSKRA